MKARITGLKELRAILAGAGHEPLSEMAVTNFVREGMPKAERGRYDVDACVAWYLGRLRSSVKRKETEKPDGSSSNLEDERKRLIAAQADNEEMTAQERRGQLVPLELYESKLASLVVTTQTRMLTLPGRLAPKLEQCTRGEAKALLHAAIRDALSAMARSPHAADRAHQSATMADAGGAAGESRRSRRKDLVEVPTATGNAGERVGGAKPVPAKGNNRKARAVRS